MLKQKEVKKIEKGEIKGSYKEVYEFLKKEKKILNVIFSVANFTVFGATVMILLPIIVHKIHGKGGKEFAFLSSVLGLGAIFGASSVIFRKPISDQIKHLFKATIILSLGLLGLNLIKNWYFTLIFCFIIGFSFANFFPVANSYLQENTPDHLRGRIISLFTLSFLGMHPVGSFIAGFLANKIGLHATLFLYITLLLFLNTYLLSFKFKPSKP
jgi:MFS family permease